MVLLSSEAGNGAARQVHGSAKGCWELCSAVGLRTSTEESILFAPWDDIFEHKLIGIAETERCAVFVLGCNRRWLCVLEFALLG